jgi:predicted ester cyclase
MDGISHVQDTSRSKTHVVRTLMECAFGKGRTDLLPRIIAEDFEGHYHIGDHYGPDGVRIDIVTYRQALPDLVVTLDDLFATGDKVVRRFSFQGTHLYPYLTVPATGQRVVLRGIGIDRVVDGRLRESWVTIDQF